MVLLNHLTRHVFSRFVSRVSPKDNHRHSLLGIQLYRPKEFAQQIGLKMEHCWAVVMKIVDLVMRQPDGKYLLLKNANQSSLRLFEISGDGI